MVVGVLDKDKNIALGVGTKRCAGIYVSTSPQIQAGVDFKALHNTTFTF